MSAGTPTVNGSTYVGGRASASGGTGVFNLNCDITTVVGALKLWNTGTAAVNLTGATLGVRRSTGAPLSKFDLLIMA